MTKSEAKHIIGQLRQGRLFAGPHSGKSWQVIPLPRGSFVQIGRDADHEEQAVLSEGEAIAFFVTLPYSDAQAMLR